MPTDDTLTLDQVHAHVHGLRAQAAQPPEKIELGRSQRAAILAGVQEATGTTDVGELREFQGLPIVKSRRDDHVKLLATGEQGEDVEVELIEPVAPSGPETPAVEEAQPSGG